MRAAVCFYGLVGSRVDKNGVGEQLDPHIAFALNKTNLIDINQADVFIHSWSEAHRERLQELYKPKASIIESQVSFPNASSIVKNIDAKQKLKEMALRLFKPSRYQDIVANREKEAFRAYSRWYSSKKVLELKKRYEDQQGFTYDAVIVLRLDVGFYSALNLADYDQQKLYASHWNDYPTENNNYQSNRQNHNVGKGLLDFWFFSNSENMDAFGCLYDKIENYHISPHRSSYEHASACGFEIGYTLYRWEDHEMIRRKEFDAVK